MLTIFILNLISIHCLLLISKKKSIHCLFIQLLLVRTQNTEERRTEQRRTSCRSKSEEIGVRTKLKLKMKNKTADLSLAFF